MIEWKTSSDPIPLQTAIRIMERRVVEIYQGKKNQLVWMLEHPHVYSGGTSSDESHLLSRPQIPVYVTNRGGSYTYHGPGQRIVYVMIDLRKYKKDIRKFVWNLEQWLIKSFRDLGVVSGRLEKRVGIWITPVNPQTTRPKYNNELKIASIGLRVKNWITYFGVSVNVNPNLSYFDNIVACGNQGYGVTSLEKQGIIKSLTEVDRALQHNFNNVFVHADSRG